MIVRISFLPLALLGVLLICGECIGGAYSRVVEVDLLGDDIQIAHQVEQLFDGDLSVVDLSWHTDISISDGEVSYLLGFQKDDFITTYNVYMACLSYKRKQRFKKIIFHAQINENSISLRVELIGRWLFSSLRISGLWIGKEELKNIYTLDPGEPFDHDKHEHACAMIRRRLFDQGYCLAQVWDRLRYKQRNKTVKVCLNVCKGPRCVVGLVSARVDVDDAISTRDMQQLENGIARLMQREIGSCRYTQPTIEQAKKSIVDYVLSQGMRIDHIETIESVDALTGVVDLVFKLSVRSIEKILFNGNTFFSDEQLLENIFHDQNISSLPISVLENELLQHYKQKGFWQATAVCHSAKGEVYCNIHEGPRAIIKKIEIVGAHYFNSSRLIRNQLVGLRGAVDEEKIKRGINSLIAHYLRRGFWDMQVVQYSYRALKKANENALVIIIHEGMQRRLGLVSVEQFPELIERMPYGTNSRGKRKPFDTAIMALQKRWLIDYFYSQGYHSVAVSPNIAEKDGCVDLNWQIQLSGERVSFGKTIINTTGTMPISIITRELCYQEGDAWDNKKIEQTLKRLRALEVFDSIYCMPALCEQNESARPVVLKLVPADPFELRFRIGFAKVSKNLTLKDNSTYKVGGSFVWHNPFGHADQMRVDADFTQFDRAITGSYRLPWIFNQPISALLKIYRTSYFHPAGFHKKATLFDSMHKGGVVVFNHEYSHGRVGLDLGLHWTGIYQTPESHGQLACVFDLNPDLIDRWVPYLLFEPHVLFDYLDESTNPTSGFLIRASVRGLIARDKDKSLGKCMLEQSYFVSLKRVVMGFHIFLGHIFNASYNNIIPTERFYLGGARTLRGYEPNSAPPLGCLADRAIDLDHNLLVPQGGKSVLNANIEARFPIWGGLSGALFQDFGFLSDENAYHAIDDTLLGSTGFGFRFKTPVGPVLRFDIGWKWHKRHPEDVPYAWFLTLGHAF